MSETPILGVQEMENSQSNPAAVINAAFRLFESLIQGRVLSRGSNAPPGSPLDGDRYIVKASPTPTGAWAGHGNAFAYYRSNAWQFQTPQNGWLVYCVDEDEFLVKKTGGWEVFSSGSSGSGLPPGGEDADVLLKNGDSDTSNDGQALWATKYFVPGGGAEGDVLTKISGDNGDAVFSAPPGQVSLQTTAQYVTDFLELSGWTVGQDGTAAAAELAPYGSGYEAGVLELDTGTDTDGEAWAILGDGLGPHQPLNCNAGLLLVDCIVFLPVASDGTDTYDVEIGVADGVGVALDNGAYFGIWDDAGTASWSALTSTGGTPTNDDVATPIITYAGIHLRIELHNYASKCRFYVDGALVSDNVLPIPTTGGYTPYFRIRKLAGTSPRKLRIDAVKASLTFDGLRYSA